MNYKKGTQTRGCMKSVMRYVSQLSKTLWDGHQLVSGIGCQPETAFAEYYTAAKGESWKFELMRVIDECMRCAGSREEFLILLRSEGYDATWTDSRKSITYVTPDRRKCRDSKLHIEKYLKENMEAEFAEQAGGLSARYSSVCKELTESTQKAVTLVLESGKREISTVTQEAKKKIRLCVWISITAVILCAALCSLAVLWSR